MSNEMNELKAFFNAGPDTIPQAFNRIVRMLGVLDERVDTLRGVESLCPSCIRTGWSMPGRCAVTGDIQDDRQECEWYAKTSKALREELGK